MAIPLLQTKLYVPQVRRSLVRRSRLVERLGPHAATTSDPGLGAARVRQDDTAGRVARRASARRPSGRVGVAGGERAGARLVLDLPGHGPRHRSAGGRHQRTLPAAGHPSPDPGRPGHAAQRARRPAVGPRPRARRLPPRRRPGDRDRPGLPGRAPSPGRAPGDQHARRSRPAAGPTAGTGRARRGPRRRPPLHAGRGGDVPRRAWTVWTWRQPTSLPWKGAPRGGSRRCSWPRSRSRVATTRPDSSRASPATTGTSWTTSSRRSWPASPTTYGGSCCRPRSWTGSAAPSATPSRVGATARPCSSCSTAPTCSSSPSTTAGTGTATTTCSPTSCARTWTRSCPET